MNSVELWGRAFDFQARAAALGVDVTHLLSETRAVFGRQLEQLTFTEPVELPVEEDEEPPVLLETLEEDELPRVRLDEEEGLFDDLPMMSVWDPEDVLGSTDSMRCKTLLMEVIMRAAHDWVLYRQSRRINDLQLAKEAHTWLFEECPGHPRWEERQQQGPEARYMSFLAICETLEHDPEWWREFARNLTANKIKCAGRPADKRKVRVEDSGIEDYCSPSVLDDLEEPSFLTNYEAQFAVGTLGMM
jgi:hypothetical protein